jgi:hypothetical protein
MNTFSTIAFRSAAALVSAGLVFLASAPLLNLAAQVIR